MAKNNRIGRRHSEETKRKISESRLGSKHPFFGKGHTEESKRKISSNNRGMLGKHHSEKTKQKMAQSSGGKVHSAETCRKMSVAHRGVPLSSSHKQAVSESLRGRPVSVATRRKMSESRTGFKNPLFGKTHSSETKRKMSEAHKKLWADKSFRDSRVSAVLKGCRVTPNKPEQKLLRFLDNRFPGEWKFVGDGSFILNGYNPDFINVNGKKQIIELFGTYWHRGEDPADRAKLFEPYGFKTLVIWEHELKNLLSVGSRVRGFQNGC